MAQIRAVFFDAGDTLVHGWTLKAERFIWLCRQAGIPVPDDPARHRAAAAAHERHFQTRAEPPPAWTDAWFHAMNRAGVDALGVPGDPDELADRIHAAAHGLRPQPRVIDPEAQPLLEQLRGEGYRLAIVSNWDGTLVDSLRPTGLAGYFDAILDSAVVGSTKPDAGIFKIACAATGVEPTQAVHVGDSPGADVAGAFRAGVRPVLLDSLDLFADGYPHLPRFERIQRLAELPALLARLRR